MAEDLATVVAEAHLPLAVSEFNWSHGNGRIFFDLRSRANHRERGEQLAGAILTYRGTCPTARVVVITHSAGAAVAIAAGEYLPAGSVDRIIMLAPAVSPGCDIRCALRASREGVDVFYSPVDGISRGLALTGTADGWNVFSAGANGFDTSAAPACANLRQHGYSSSMAKTGHLGGHYGWTKIGFLREYVVPLVAGCQ
jgi:pimeloyl-ACP methyl ester carboxylesterase